MVIDITEKELLELKKANIYLRRTDYIANKIIEYQFLNKELDKDYTEILTKREEAREIIRSFESR